MDINHHLRLLVDRCPVNMKKCPISARGIHSCQSWALGHILIACVWSAVKKKHVGYCKQNYNVLLVGLVRHRHSRAEPVWESRSCRLYMVATANQLLQLLFLAAAASMPPKKKWSEASLRPQKSRPQARGISSLLPSSPVSSPCSYYSLLPWARFSSKKCHANLNLLAPEKMESVASVAFFLGSQAEQMKGMTCMMCLSHSSTAKQRRY